MSFCNLLVILVKNSIIFMLACVEVVVCAICASKVAFCCSLSISIFILLSSSSSAQFSSAFFFLSSFCAFRINHCFFMSNICSLQSSEHSIVNRIIESTSVNVLGVLLYLEWFVGDVDLVFWVTCDYVCDDPSSTEMLC